MNAIQQKCRPKHQVLVLKCYPRTTKGAVDVKPNSSELSYLLYYATSRRSKIQKIGAFLEKKTASDVWRLRIGNVQVTLQILAALIEKLHKDAVLIAPFVLKVLDTVLRSEDITMIESSLPTFEAFCDFHDAALLSADQAFLHQYEEIVRLYAQLASTHLAPGKESLSSPVKVRWRSAGLEAIRSISTADALSSITGRQMDVIMPRILDNLWSDTPDFLEVLLQRVEAEEKVDTEKQLRRRTSIATVATVDTAGDPNPVALAGTAGDVDKLAEEEVGVLAMQCLKSIFIVPNRSQIHGATVSLLRFIQDRVSQGESVVELHDDRERDGGWAISIYSIISRWTPVQDRYIILVAALDTLLRIPVQDATLDSQLALTTMMSSLLRSDVNLIGLSVMDVLLGLIKQMRKLLRLRSPASQSDDGDAATEPEQAVRQQTKHLLGRLELCIGDLATHVYYADQISDMITAVILRLKPSRSSSTSSSPGGEKAGEAGPGASNIELSESQQLDHYFSLSAGRASALHVIKAILLVANPQKKLTGNMALSRNPVPIHVWEGTHWLLRDPDGHVRKAYMDALITWLDREATIADEVAVDETLPRSRSSIKINRELSAAGTRRAVSNASHNKERASKTRSSQFLPLLHLVIYDNALQFYEYENDLVMLHILLTKLAFKLGVNAVRHGLPMIYRLQEDIQEIDTPLHKVRIAALCHGYFWALTEKFDFEASVVGRAIQNEVVRRRSKGFWIEGIHIPPPSTDIVGFPGETRPHPEWDAVALEREELLPFDDRSSLVECVAANYHETIQTPPGSPAISPSRGLSGPILGSTLSSTTAPEPETELPAVFREQMLTDWSRDAAVAMMASVGKSESLSGSKTGTSVTQRGHLTVNTNGINGNGNNGPVSPYGSQYNLMRPHSSHAFRERDRDGTPTKNRKGSMRSAVSPALSVSNRGGTVASVEQLKLVLSGNPPPKTAGLAGDDDSGDSMVSYDYSPSEISFNPATQTDEAISPTKRPATASARRGGPLGAHPPLGGPPNLHDEKSEDDESVPPVPPLPNVSLLGGKRSPIQSIEASFQDSGKSGRRSLYSRGGDGTRPKSVRSQNTKTMDLQDLLRGIDSRPSEGSLGNVTRPPY
ncbi:Protein EFR3 [Fusarium floridanum]|uniref:Protein EFR3 n=1 Tax=Fusarium floridanum TaxID=1325733 RepID=A0A428QYT7_9HYPO|nr:Protein EFR3 [Fusarium floridanum]